MAESAAEPMKLTIEQAIDRLGMGSFQHRLLFAAGLCSGSDAMEVLLLSFLAIVVQHEFSVGPHEGSLLTSIVFIGALVGTSILGPMADRWGRKPVFVLSAGIISAAGLATAAVQSYWMMVAMRFGVGVGLGGNVICYDTLAEFIPTADRGHYLMRTGYFWTAGVMLTSALAFFGLQEEKSWRIFVLLCSVPCVLSTILAMFWVPESPRWLVTQGKADKALEILRKGAITNGKDPLHAFPEGVHFVRDPNEEEGLHSIFCLFKPGWRLLTLSIWGVWMGKAFMYWGTIQIVTLVFSTTDRVGEGVPYAFDYGAIFSSSVAEIVGVSIAICLVDRTGRVRTQAILYIFGGAMVFGLCSMTQSIGNSDDERGPLIVLAFLARMFVVGATNLTWCVTAELIPTQVRTTGHASASAVARLGGAATPWLASTGNSFQTMGIAMACISLYTGIMVWMLPETAGRSMGTARLASDAEEKTLKEIV